MKERVRVVICRMGVGARCIEEDGIQNEGARSVPGVATSTWPTQDRDRDGGYMITVDWSKH